MAEDVGEERHSVALEAELITDPDEKARREARNTLRQYDQIEELVTYWLAPERPFKLRVSNILHLNRVALEGIHPLAGTFRPGPVEIRGSKHEPPNAGLVPELVEAMCDYVNDNFNRLSALHLSSFVMWRMNWIHPFADGNGRTARAVSYFVLCVRMGYWVPGKLTVPELISKNKDPYYAALEAADKNDLHSAKFDLSAMESYIGDLLAKQLVGIHEDATNG